MIPVTIHRADLPNLGNGDRIEVGAREFSVRLLPSHHQHRDSDERLGHLAAVAFEAGLVSGRAVVRPMSREALVDHLDLLIVKVRRPLYPCEITFEESEALRIVYGAGHKASARARRSRAAV